ncbi:hypothetical protein RIF29_14655 [Crotalaria pallida]|uniref:Uncharacterized protein n=1 Tax=Crotalaria pallida TaxID=3830 RepID=A0AAN9FC33_CROPI
MVHHYQSLVLHYQSLVLTPLHRFFARSPSLVLVMSFNSVAPDATTITLSDPHPSPSQNPNKNPIPLPQTTTKNPNLLSQTLTYTKAVNVCALLQIGNVIQMFAGIVGLGEILLLYDCMGVALSFSVSLGARNHYFVLPMLAIDIFGLFYRSSIMKID